MTRRLLVRASACTAVLCAALALAPGAAWAQDDDDAAADPVVVHINGPCVLTVDHQARPCRGVSYMVFPSNHRINFTAVTDTAGWAFSGEEDQNDEDGYALTLDSLVTPEAGRIDADGECDMQVGEDGRTVDSLRCEAATDDGDLVLEASGKITVDDADEGDDEGDDGPESGQG